MVEVVGAAVDGVLIGTLCWAATPFQISTLPNFGCGSNINLSLTISSTSHGSFVVPVVLGSGEPANTPIRYDNSVVTNIPDVGAIESTNVVAGFAGPITRVVASVYLTHAFDGDLSISLINPDGISVDLTSGNGGSGDDFGTNCAPDAARTTFDDSAATNITAGSGLMPIDTCVTLAHVLGLDASPEWDGRLVKEAFGR